MDSSDTDLNKTTFVDIFEISHTTASLLTLFGIIKALFYLFIYFLSIFGCVGSSLLRAGFL